MKINKQDTNGVKAILSTGELGYDNYPAGGDAGRVYVGNGAENIPQAKKAEVVAVDGKVDTHIARVDNPHSVTKTQVGLSNVDNTSDLNKPVSTAIQTALDLKANLASPALTGTPTAPTASVGTSSTMVATTAFVNAEIANDTYSKAQLNAGQLDNRYYTETEIDTLNNTTVKLTGNQTIEDVKTFTSSPIVPTPTTDFQVATKKYVDEAISIYNTDDLATYTGLDLVIVKDINRGGTFVSKTAIEIDPNTGSLYTVNEGTVFAKLGGGFWVRQYNGAVNVKWFNAKGDGVTNDSIPVKKAIDSNAKVKFPKGIYLINIELNKYFELYGDGLLETIIKPYSTSTPAILNMYQEPDWRATSINNIGFESTSQTGIGFSYGNYGNYTTGQELIGRVVFNLCSFKGFDKGVRKSFGNIGNVYNQCYFHDNNYGSWAKDAQSSSPASNIMHTGCDTYNGGEFHGNKKASALYMDNCGGNGQITFNQTILQFNEGFGVRFETILSNTGNPIVFSNVWEEGNATAASVAIDTLTGVQTLTPKSIDIIGVKNGFHRYGNQVGLDTLNPSATLGIYRNQEWAINLIAGGYAYGLKYNGIKFSDYGTEHISGAGISASTTGATTEKTLYLESNNLKMISVEPTGTTKVGNTAVQYGANINGSHVIYSTLEVGGANILKVGSRFSGNHLFNIVDGTPSNGAACAYSLGAVASTGRSINAGGTINASGADYAEYEYNNGIKFEKGDIVGFKEDGTLTDKYSEAIRFAIKSTNPSYVGGDVWGDESIVGKKPEYPFKKIDVMEKVIKEDEIIEDIIVEKGYTQEEWELILLDYENEMKEYEIRLETERQKVDRIAYSGKVPVNVYVATAGQYIVAIEKDGGIDGLAVDKVSMTFIQYQDAVGRVNKILNDGRAEVAVIIH